MNDVFISDDTYRMAVAIVFICCFIPFVFMHEFLHWIVVKSVGINSKLVFAKHKKFIYGLGILIKDNQPINRNVMVVTYLMPQIITLLLLYTVIKLSMVYGFIDGFQYISVWYGLLAASIAGSSADYIGAITCMGFKETDYFEGYCGGTIIWEKNNMLENKEVK